MLARIDVGFNNFFAIGWHRMQIPMLRNLRGGFNFMTSIQECISEIIIVSQATL